MLAISLKAKPVASWEPVGVVEEVLEDAPPDVLASGVDFDSPPLEGLQAVERQISSFSFTFSPYVGDFIIWSPFLRPRINF